MQPNLRRISDYVYVTGQLEADDLPGLAEAGFTVLVNHRPDDEDASQPMAAEIAARAQQEGISSFHAPVRGFPDETAVVLTREALDAAGPGGKVAMFCRSGMRSACAWALAERINGADPDALRASALAAGYDLGRVPL